MTAVSYQTPAPGPLNGLVVADFSRVLAGPLASMFLGDLFAANGRGRVAADIRRAAQQVSW